MKRYSDPYFAGIGIGLVLLASYVVVGRGIGASGAFASIAAAVSASVSGATSPATAPYLQDGVRSPLKDWLVLELVGVTLGGFTSAWLAGRMRIDVERGPGIGSRQRIAAAFSGGIFMGLGAKLARGCTSGQALTGGALLSVGSWVFIVSCFATGYLLAPLARRLWR